MKKPAKSQLWLVAAVALVAMPVSLVWMIWTGDMLSLKTFSTAFLIFIVFGYMANEHDKSL